MPATKKFAVEGIGTERSFPSASRALSFVKTEHRRSRPLPVCMVIRSEESGDSMTFIVGGERTFLQHIPKGGDPPYMTSAGSSKSSEPFVFLADADGEESEAPHFYTIPFERGFEALEHWLREGTLSKAIKWVEG